MLNKTHFFDSSGDFFQHKRQASVARLATSSLPAGTHYRLPLPFLFGQALTFQLFIGRHFPAMYPLRQCKLRM
jgi:hypothetical protein